MDKQEKILKGKLIITIISVAIVLIGTSFAIFSQIINSQKRQVIKAGAISLLLTESGEGFDLTESLVKTDAEGLQSSPYEFTIRNNGTETARYKITLVNDNDAIQQSGALLLNDEYIRYGLEVNDTEIGPLTLEEVNRIIYSDTISPDETDTFSLRLWLNFDGLTEEEIEDQIDKVAYFNIKVRADQIINLDTSGANIPKLALGMIPVYYDSIEEVWKKADFNNYDPNNKWYDYDNGMWANAVTVTSATRNNYLNADIGETILESDINTMWVWIPKFEYKSTNLGVQYAGGIATAPGAISINFIEKNTITPTNANFQIHDAFTFNNAISGFWYGKFETTGTLATACANESCDISSLTILPNQASLTSQTLGSFFYAGRSMEKANNPYGFSSNEIETHLSKNNEWGAVTYLTQSIYGRCSNATTCEEVSSNLVSVQVQSVSSTITGCTYNNAVGALNNQCPSGYAYNETNNNGISSTTGNVYGIYDMHGGNAEYVVGNFNNTAGSSSLDISSIEAKYKNTYTVSYNGHALTETSGWYSDEATFVDATSPWLTRGGDFSYAISGIFNFNSSTGDAGVYSSRMAIIVN